MNSLQNQVRGDGIPHSEEKVVDKKEDSPHSCEEWLMTILALEVVYDYLESRQAQKEDEGKDLGDCVSGVVRKVKRQNHPYLHRLTAERDLIVV